MYMYLANLYDKLFKVFKTHDNIYLAIDFDDTIYDWKSKGYTCNLVVDLVKRCQDKLNAKVLLYTCRQGAMLDEAVKYCETVGINLYGVNDNPDYPKNGSKMYYNVLLDDKASLPETCAVLEALLYSLFEKSES